MYKLDEKQLATIKLEICRELSSFVDEEKKRKILEEIVSLNDSIDEGLPSEETVASMQEEFEKSASQAKETAISEYERSLSPKEDDMLAEFENKKNEAIDFLGTLEYLFKSYKKDLSKLGALHFIKKKRLREKIDEYARKIEKQKKTVSYLEEEYEQKKSFLMLGIMAETLNIRDTVFPTSPLQKFIAQKYIYQNWPIAFSNMTSDSLSRNSDMQNKGIFCCILVILSIMNRAASRLQICEILEYIKEQAPVYNLPDFIGSVSNQRVYTLMTQLEKEDLVERLEINDCDYYIIKNTK